MITFSKFSTVSTKIFWTILENNWKQFNVNHIDIAKVMYPYISQFGYPVVNVERNYKNGTIKLTQECFVCSMNKTSKWWIPINYATENSLNFSSTFANYWMDPNNEGLLIENIDPQNWIIINIQASGNELKILHYLKN